MKEIQSDIKPEVLYTDITTALNKYRRIDTVFSMSIPEIVAVLIDITEQIVDDNASKENSEQIFAAFSDLRSMLRIEDSLLI